MIDQKKACDDIAACVASCLRGFTAMDAHAEQAGASKADTACLEYTAENGTVIVVTRDERSWPAIKAQRPDVVTYTMREVANALERDRGVFNFANEQQDRMTKFFWQCSPCASRA